MNNHAFEPISSSLAGTLNQFSLRPVITAILLILLSTGNAQSFKTPVDYLDYLADLDKNLTKNYLSYMSTVAHSNNARRMEKRRQEVLESIQSASRDLSRLKPYNGDAGLRNAYREFYKILYSVFNEDYHKIVDMEEIAEQSYDAMEAYMLAQEKASDRLAQASEQIQPALDKFAAVNNITIVDSQGKDSKRMRQVSVVNAYNRTLYLVFFKTFKQEIYLTTSISENDINGAEQNRNTLLKYLDEGFAKLDTIRPFKGDGSLLNACRRVLNFQKVAADKSREQIDLMVKFDEFAKIKKSFEAKSEQQRTRTDIDTYNAAINNYNKDAQRYNQISEELNKARNSAYESFYASRKRFLGAHIPQA